MKLFLLLAALGIYLVPCAYLYFKQRSMLYYPQPARVMEGAREVTYQHEGESLSGWVLHEGQDKALLYLGGNAEQIEHNEALFPALFADRSVYLPHYRGYGNSTGEPTEEALYSDALFLFDHIARHHSSVVVMGRSLGSGVATYVAARRPVEKLILVTPYDSIEGLARQHYPYLPVSLLLKDKFRSDLRAPEIEAPTLIIVAEDDTTVPPPRSKRLLERFDSAVATLKVIEGRGHNDVADAPAYADAIRRFLALPRGTAR